MTRGSVHGRRACRTAQVPLLPTVSVRIPAPLLGHPTDRDPSTRYPAGTMKEIAYA